jgi:RNA polymerase sigma-70 factor (ECF subfamily)
MGCAMSDEPTTAVVQRYLDEPGGNSPAVPIVRALLDRSVRRLHLLCATLLHRSYPRLTRPPLTLQADELLGAIAERLLKALREARPRTMRQLFALANQHIRWELNDLARRLDDQPAAAELNEGLVPSPPSSASGPGPDGLRMLRAIDELPEDEREVFDPVRIQGMSQAEAAQLLGVSTVTVKRRLSRGPRHLAERLADLRPGEGPTRSRPTNHIWPSTRSLWYRVRNYPVFPVDRVTASAVGVWPVGPPARPAKMIIRIGGTFWWCPI